MMFVYRILYFFISKTESLIWYIKRKVLLSSLASCGEKVWIGRHWKITPGRVHIGNDVSIGPGCVIQSSGSDIIFGDHIMLRPNVSIHGCNHRHDLLGRYMKDSGVGEKRAGMDDADVVIEDDVWIGDGAIILKGVAVGRGSVIGAGTVVYKSVPRYSIVTSSKMEVRERFTREQIKAHERALAQSMELPVKTRT